MSGQKWNRSSAFDPTTLGILNSLTAQAIQDAIARFEKAVDISILSEEQRVEATEMLVHGVTEGMATFVEQLKASGRPTLDCERF